MARRQKDEEIDVVDWLRKLPKVELHLHLEGTIQPETLLELSSRHDAEPLTADAARKLYIYENFSGFMDSFKAVSARLKGPDDYELITYNMIRELAAQGVVHAEVYISFGIIYYWKNVEVEPFVEAIERGRVRQGGPRCQVGALLQHEIRRREDPRKAKVAARRLEIQMRCGRGLQSVNGCPAKRNRTSRCHQFAPIR